MGLGKKLKKVKKVTRHVEKSVVRPVVHAPQTVERKGIRPATKAVQAVITPAPPKVVYEES